MDLPGLQVAAVVINHNGRDHLIRCLAHLRRLSPGCDQIVVVDDASTDGSVPWVMDSFPEVSVLQLEKQAGPSVARNAGARRAMDRFACEFLLFLDNDAFLQPTALGELLRSIGQAPDIGIAIPKAYVSMSERRLHGAGGMTVNLFMGAIRDVGAGEVDRGQHDAARYVQACGGYALLVRATLLEEIGGFDEAFAAPAWEDADFSLRARKAGFRIAYAPEAIVEHVGGRIGRGSIPARETAKAKNWFLLMRRHATLLQWTSFLAFLPLRASGLLLGDVLRGDWMGAAARMGAAPSLLAGLSTRGRPTDEEPPDVPAPGS